MEKHNKKSRIFSFEQKLLCWNKADFIQGRDPKRWRYDAAGNPVLNALRGCKGQLCHEYNHIIPFSKGGETSTENCQILQTHVNRFKRDNILRVEELANASIKEIISGREMDLIEYMVYGNISK